METIDGLKDILENGRPNSWDEIPDIDLYMDQVLNYMKRQHIGLQMDETLTSAMINNYIKKDLLPRAKGKKYNREHVAYLTAICLLKQVLSVDNTGKLLKKRMEKEDVRSFYDEYTDLLDKAFKKLSEEIDQEKEYDNLQELALRLAISSYAQKLACEYILELDE